MSPEVASSTRIIYGGWEFFSKPQSNLVEWLVTWFSYKSKHINIKNIFVSGSVTASNSNILAHQPDVDGFLVGGASLKVYSVLLFLSLP